MVIAVAVVVVVVKMVKDQLTSFDHNEHRYYVARKKEQEREKNDDALKVYHEMVAKKFGNNDD